MLRVALLLLLAVRGAVALFESFSRWASKGITEDEAFRALERMGKEIHGPRPDGWRAGGSRVPPSPSCRLAPLDALSMARTTSVRIARTRSLVSRSRTASRTTTRSSWTCASVWDATCLRWIPQSTTMPSSPTASTSSSGARRARAASTHPRSRAATTRRRGHPRQGDVGAWLKGTWVKGAWEFEPLAPRHMIVPWWPPVKHESAARARARTRSARVRHASTLGFVAVLVILTCCWWSWRRRQKE